MIELNNIYKTYYIGTNKLEVLKNINLKIEEGDFIAIMGPSGSGKSTLMHILGLLDTPSNGIYLLNKTNILELAKKNDKAISKLRRDEIGFIFQQFNLLNRNSAIENVALPLLYSERKIDYIKAKNLLKTVALEDRIYHKPNELSGGQQQRVAIARSLINDPKIILADEPTGNLDSYSEKEILNILKSLNQKGITVIIVTHEEEIAKESKRIIRLKDGFIVSDTRLKPLNNFKIDSSKSSDFSYYSNLNKKDNNKVNFLDYFEYIKQSFKVLNNNKVRTILSILGILIGVAAVVAMMSLASGAKKAIERQLSSLGSNLLVLMPGSLRIGGIASEEGSPVRLQLNDISYLKETVNYIKDISPSVDGRVQAVYKDKNYNTLIQGVSTAYEKLRNSTPMLGRFFTDEEAINRTRVAVIGTTVLKELFENQNPIGEMIKINRINFQIIGVLPHKGARGFRDQDDIIIVPIQTAMYRVLGRTHLKHMDIEIISSQYIKKAENLILEALYKRYNVPVSQKDNAFRIRNMADLQVALSETNKVMGILLALIAGISLLVGGIGIMNIMLVSVTERTKEIGLRKAIGANKDDILFQFLIESLVITVFGGFFGIIIGILASYSLSYFAAWQTSISFLSIIVAFSSSAIIGIIFGLYPAKKASKLNPIEALRYE
jgi:macrolide transport system ATP-binding/permease protein